MIQEQISDRKRQLIFINIVITCVAASLLSTALTVAVKPISAQMNISENTTQWLTSGYNLTMGIAMPLTAFLVRRFKTKSLYLVAIGSYLVGLIVALVSWNFPVLMVGRCFQAVGNGLLLSMSQVVILSIFPAERRGTAMGWYGLALTAAPVVAPTLSGILVDTIGWKSIFAFVLVIMGAAFIMAICVMDNVLETSKSKFDFTSFVMSIFGFGGITLGVGNLASGGITAPLTFIPLIVGVVGMILFVMRQIRVDVPYLNLRTFRTRNFTIAVIGNMMLYFVMYGSSMLTPMLFQNLLLGVKENTSTWAGLYMLPGSIAIAVISPFAGKLYDKVGIKPLFVVGSACLLVSNAGMALLTVESPPWAASVFYAIRSVCIGCMLTPLVTFGSSSVPKEQLSDATAIINSFRTIAGSIGSALFVGVMTMAAARAIDNGNATATGRFTIDQVADMSGQGVAYWAMAGCTVVLLLIAVIAVRGRKKEAALAGGPALDEAEDDTHTDT